MNVSDLVVMRVPVSEAHERAVRKFLLLRGDRDFALHAHLKNYFFAGAPDFGVLDVCRGTSGPDSGFESLIFFSVIGGTACFHYCATDKAEAVDAARQHMGMPTCAFIAGLDTASSVGQWLMRADWRRVLNVTPGFTIDHPLYSTLFSRVVPRFQGIVYEHD